jgi:hydroxyethylthiazole kinase
MSAMTHETWALLQLVRRQAPMVHLFTGAAAADFAASTALAVGAIPVTAMASAEVEDIVPTAGALLINIRPLDPDTLAGMRLAAKEATEAGVRWVLDAVGVGATPFRTDTARGLVRRKPNIIRGNADEIIAMASTEGVQAHGFRRRVRFVEDAFEPAVGLAASLGCTVVVSGRTDFVTDGQRRFKIDNGHPGMLRVNGIGCALSALITSFLTVEPDAVLAATMACGCFGLAGELAAAQAAGPGSLRMHLIDALHGFDGAALRDGLQISEG